MARDLKLEVVLAAIDKATKPIRAITQGSVGLARTMKATRDTLKGLQSQQKDVSSFKALKGANDQTQQAMRASTDRVKALSRELANTSNPTKALNNEFKRAVRESQQLKQKHGEQQQQLQGLRTRLSAAGISTRNLSQHERDLRQKLASTNQSLRQQEDRLRRVTQQQQRMAKAKASYEKSQQLAGSMATSGAAGLAAGSGVLYGLGRLIQPGIEFDTTMSKVQALTRLDKNDDQLKALREQARELGATTMFSAGDAASGMAFLGMAGFTPEAIAAAMPGLLDMAKAGEVELGRTADIASNILSGFKIDPAQMGMVADVLTKAFTTSNTTLEGLGETMGYVGPVAAQAGMSLEETAAMAGLLGNVGIQSSKSGTALRAMLLRLAAPAGPAAKKMAELGISAKDSAGNMRGILDVLGDTAKAIEHMGSGDQLAALKAVFGEEPAAGMAELIEKAGSGGIEQYLDVVRDYQGAAAATAKVIGDNITGDLDELSSAVDDVRITGFDQLNDELRELTKSLAGIVGRFGVWAKKNPALVSTIIKLVAGLAALVAAGGALTVMLASILGPLAMIKYGFAMASVAAGAFSLPVLAVIAAIVLLGVAAWMLWKNWDGVVGGLKALWAGLVGAARYAFDALLAFFSGIWGEIKMAFDGGITGISALIINWSPLGLFYQAFAGVMSYFGVDLPGKFTEFGGMLMSGMVQGIKNGLGAVKDSITGAGDAAVGWFKDKLGIRSPSRVFASLGDDTMAGLEQGLERSKSGPMAAIIDAGKALAGAAAFGLGMAGNPALADVAPVADIMVDSRPPLSAAAPAPAAAPTYNISINVHSQPGMDEAELARLVAREMQKATREAQARIRSSLYDND